MEYIRKYAKYLRICGSTTPERNIISGNDANGVLVYEGANSLFQNNYVGFDVTGTKAIGNFGDAFRLVRTDHTTIKGNLIGNNSGYAVHNGAGTNTLVTGNTLVNDVLFLVMAV